jgi:hypothetical protein
MHKYAKNMHKHAIICSITFIKKKDKFHRINLFIQNLLIQGVFEVEVFLLTCDKVRLSIF